MAEDMARTLLFYDDADVEPAGHRDSWSKNVPEASNTMAVWMTKAEVIGLRRLCRHEKRRPSVIVGEMLSEKLKKT